MHHCVYCASRDAASEATSRRVDPGRRRPPAVRVGNPVLRGRRIFRVDDGHGGEAEGGGAMIRAEAGLVPAAWGRLSTPFQPSLQRDLARCTARPQHGSSDPSFYTPFGILALLSGRSSPSSASWRRRPWSVSWRPTAPAIAPPLTPITNHRSASTEARAYIGIAVAYRTRESGSICESDGA